VSQSVAIAGCGVAGLTAALLLARQDHAVTLFEQSAEVGPVGAGVLLQPSGQMVLREMGLLERVTARAERIDRLHALNHRGKTLIDLPYAGVAPGLHAHGLARSDLFAVLHAEADAAGIRIVLNSRIVRFTDHGRQVELFDDQNVSRGLFDLLLAADGSRSQLRRASGLAVRLHEYPHGALWALGKCSAIKGKLHQVTHGTRLLCGLLPMGEGRCSLFWSVEKGQKEALFARSFDSWQKEVCATLPEARELVAGLRSFDDARFVTYCHVQMRRWHTDRFLLLGDAAHSMSPHLGQGINLALLDGWTIAHAMAQEPTTAQAFELYCRLRRGHTNFYARITSLLSPFFQSGGVIKGWGRDMALPLLPRVPVFRYQMLLTMTGLKQSYFGGKIDLPSGRPRG
jgi:2-polyprenyl-6-methoxyphenol hydroxylase-like FAD-dependent oxidoreductase